MRRRRKRPGIGRTSGSHPVGRISKKLARWAIFFEIGWTGRIRTCECWDQNPVPYHLATVQSLDILAQKTASVETKKKRPTHGRPFSRFMTASRHGR